MPPTAPTNDAPNPHPVDPQPITSDMLRDYIADEQEYVINLRHAFHKRPEIAYQEHETSQMIKDELDKLGVTFRDGFAGTGIVAHIPATSESNATSIGLRADIDGLPILEQSGLPYSSTRDGYMHACGHDGHMAIILGVIRVLMKLETRPNPVTVVFQPAEEGGAGAKKMVEEGALACLGPPIKCMFGLHGWPHMSVGNVGSCVGAITAATLVFDVVINGTQTHGGFPHLSADPIVATAHIITALQTIVSRNCPPKEAAVVTIGQISGGTTHNIIPAQVSFRGTVRVFKVELQSMIIRNMERIISNVAASFGCEGVMKIGDDGYPPTMNDATLVGQWFDGVSEAMGPSSVKTVEPFTGGEDFAFYGHAVPSLFFFLGLRPEGELLMPFLHAQDFDFNDDAIKYGMLAMLKMAVSDVDVE